MATRLFPGRVFPSNFLIHSRSSYSKHLRSPSYLPPFFPFSNLTPNTPSTSSSGAPSLSLQQITSRNFSSEQILGSFSEWIFSLLTNSSFPKLHSLILISSRCLDHIAPVRSSSPLRHADLDQPSDQLTIVSPEVRNMNDGYSNNHGAVEGPQILRARWTPNYRLTLDRCRQRQNDHYRHWRDQYDHCPR